MRTEQGNEERTKDVTLSCTIDCVLVAESLYAKDGVMTNWLSSGSGAYPTIYVDYQLGPKSLRLIHTLKVLSWLK